MINSLLKNWSVYLIEAWALDTFMFSVCVFVILFQHPYFGLQGAIPNALITRGNT